MTGRRIAAGLCALAVALTAAVPAHAQGDEARYRLANGCYALGANGRLVAKDGAGGYAARATEGAAAEAFRMQATTLGQYLLFGRGGDFLSSNGDRVVTEPKPSPSSDWRVETAGDRLTLRLASTGRALALDGDRLVLGDTPTPLRLPRQRGLRDLPRARAQRHR
jgi:hypothetical protein